jgi:hypothetical protein
VTLRSIDYQRPCRASTKDKQLCCITVEEVLEKRRLDQALNAKEFAVLAGISYSTAREWFRLESFPVFRGVVFWEDFVEWRKAQTGLVDHRGHSPPTLPAPLAQASQKALLNLPPRAAAILADAG